MAKEFDIYLKRRITECDLIVYSLPYRDGLTATNRIILESCLESYTLQKFVAMQLGSELVSHIDKMIKTCYERLNWGTAIDVNAAFQTLYTMNPESSIVELAVEDIPALETMFAEAESRTAIEIAALVLGTELHFSFGRAYGGMAFGAKVSGEHMQKYEIVENNLRILADVTESIRQFVGTEGSTVDLTVNASTILKRHRLLAEMDADELSEYDDMTLDEVDFVIL